MGDTKLKSCPFCGGEAEVIKRESEYPYVHGVWCKGCRCRTSFEKSREEAIEAWNTRRPMERIVEQLKEQRESYGEKFVNSNIILQDAIETVQKGAHNGFTV